MMNPTTTIPTTTPPQQQIQNCPICKQPSTNIRDIEKLPSGTILAIAEHGNGEYHRYGKFVLHEKRGKLEKQVGLKVICPKCGKEGLAYTKNDWKDGMPEHERYLHRLYYVRHGPYREGGIAHSCEKQEDRDNILKQLNRYISTPPQSPGQIKKKRGHYKKRNKIQKKLDRERRLKLKEPTIQQNMNQIRTIISSSQLAPKTNQRVEILERMETLTKRNILQLQEIVELKELVKKCC